MLTTNEAIERCLYPEVRIRTPKALGSGTVIFCEPTPGDEGLFDAYVLTNEHVVDNLIDVDDKWDTILKKETKQETLGHPDVELFRFAWFTRKIGGTSFQASIMCYDKEEDMALLRVRSPEQFEHVAAMYPEPKIRELRAFMGVWNVGCGLGGPPAVTHGFISAYGIDIDHKDFMLVTANSIFGNCLPGDSLVSMADNSVKPISEVQVGDTVWSLGPTGLSQNTVQDTVASGEKEIYEIHTRTRTVRASGNHPVLAVTGTKGWDGRIANVAAWKRVQQLGEGDVIAVLPGLPERQRATINFSQCIGQYSDWYGFMRLLGFYLGDGWMRHEPSYRYEVSLACYDQVAFDRYAALLFDLFKLEPTKHAAPEVLQVNSKELVELLERLGFAGKATEKTVPDWVFTVRPDLQQAFLEGYLEADGYVDKTGSWVFEANNEPLIRRLRMLCIHMGYNVSNVHVRERPATWVDGRLCKATAASASFQVYPQYSKNRSTFMPGDKSFLPPEVEWEQVSRIKSVGSEMTYDIKLDACHTFFADGVLVHNSGGATFYDETGELVGIPSRIALTTIGWNADAITHLGFSIPVPRVYDFLRAQVFDFIIDPARTSSECAEQREKMRLEDRLLRRSEPEPQYRNINPQGNEDYKHRYYGPD